MEKQHKKMRYIFGKITILSLLAISFTSCTDELEQINPKQVTIANSFQNIGDLNTGLNAVYSALTDNELLGLISEAQRTDIAVPTSLRQSTLHTELSEQTFDLTTRFVNDKWAALYQGVFRANQVIDGYNKLKVDFSEKQEENAVLVVAQARALRAFFYYELHSSFNNGVVPLFKTVPLTTDKFQKAFSKADTVKEFYRSELEYVISLENFPDNYSEWQSEKGENLGRITKGACEAILAKSYINENDFENAKPLLENVIENYGYVLTDHIKDNFTGLSEFNSESIFEINYTNELNELGQGEENLAQRVSSDLFRANGLISPSSWLTQKYINDKLDPNDEANFNRNLELFTDKGKPMLDDLGNPQFVEMDTLRTYSLRTSSSIAIVNDPDSKLYGVKLWQYGDDQNATPLNRISPTRFKKFTQTEIITDGSGEIKTNDNPRFNRSTVNIPVIRLADVYLMYAECMLEDGNTNEALSYINKVRHRSHLILLGPPTSEFGSATFMNDIDMDDSNGEESVNLSNLMDHLRFTERPLELSLEGNRGVDLRRWGVWKEQLTKISKLRYDSFHFKAYPGLASNKIRFRSFIIPSGEIPPFALAVPANGFDHKSNRRFDDAILRDANPGADNFIEADHSYLPVPQAEIITNKNWDKIED